MLTFPLHNAALDLKGKPPEELPHGLLPIPPEVRELVEMERAKHCRKPLPGPKRGCSTTGRSTGISRISARK